MFEKQRATLRSLYARMRAAHFEVLGLSMLVGVLLWVVWLWWIGGWAHGQLVAEVVPEALKAADSSPASRTSLEKRAPEATLPSAALAAPPATASAASEQPQPVVASSRPASSAPVIEVAPTAMAGAVAAPPSAVSPDAARAVSARAFSPQEPDREKRFAELGQTGDFFGGLNTLLTALAGAIVFWAGYLQKEQLKEARSAAALAESEAQAEKQARKRREFESLFFQVLGLTREVMDRIETPPLTAGRNERTREIKKIPARKGAAALDNLASRIYRHGRRSEGHEERFKELVWRYGTSVYNVAPSALGPYFRMLYQLFNLVAESGLEEPDQVRYANIARAQISEGAVLLLALNGWGPYGYKFVPLIEKFGLLEHMLPKYKLRFGKDIEWAYRPRAFLGKSERAKAENSWVPEPLHPQIYKLGAAFGQEPPQSDNEVPEDEM